MLKLFQLVRRCSFEDTDQRTVHVRLDLAAPDQLRLQYRVSGDVASLKIPAHTNPTREDRLWTHTCFELFIKGSGDSYCEFNFSPSSQWAAYRFDSYRQGMAELSTPSAPSVAVEVSANAVVVSGSVDLRGLDEVNIREGSRVALAAVIENNDGQLSYWALAHPQGKPDFHHPDSFVPMLLDNGD